jgi:hypothetical protein
MGFVYPALKRWAIFSDPRLAVIEWFGRISAQETGSWSLVYPVADLSRFFLSKHSLFWRKPCPNFLLLISKSHLLGGVLYSFGIDSNSDPSCAYDRVRFSPISC